MQLTLEDEHPGHHQSAAFVVAEKPTTPKGHWEDVPVSEITGSFASGGHAAQHTISKGPSSPDASRSSVIDYIASEGSASMRHHRNRWL